MVVDLGLASNSSSETEPECRPVFLYSSKRNAFGILRHYMLASAPTHDPDQALTLSNLTDSLSSSFPTTGADTSHSLGPFNSRSAFDLAEWYWNSAAKSFLDFQKLINILQKPSFSLDDATGVNWKRAFQVLGSNADELPGDQGDWIDDDGWLTTPITIDVPFHNRLRDPGVKPYLACSFRHRNLISVIKEKLGDSRSSSQFHYYPFKSAWKGGDESPEVELYGELYTSRAFRDAHEEVQRKPPSHHNDGLERSIVALMFWSDSTQLTSFGNASLWPCYLFFGNESKYQRCRPSDRMGQQIAYFNKVCIRSSSSVSGE